MKTLHCRSCQSANLHQILDLGFSPPSNSLLEPADLFCNENYFPLVLVVCEVCSLVQTLDFHQSSDLFTPDYPYLSSTSKTWLQHCESLIHTLREEYGLNSEKLVAEVASNDGYLLQHLQTLGIPNYGIEPTEKAARISLSKGHTVYQEFLDINSATRIVSQRGTADFVIANNVFAHVPNLKEFSLAVRALLKPKGILVIEIQYFGILLKEALFDTVYHEHYSYFTVASLTNLLKSVGLAVFRVDEIQTHGGSIRVYARNHSECNDSPLLSSDLLQMEQISNSIPRLSDLQLRVSQKRDRVREFFLNSKSKGRTLIGVGAAAKGISLLNYCGITKEDLPYVLDSAQTKQGKLLPGVHSSVIPFDSSLIRDNNDFVILPWNIASELVGILQQSYNNKSKIYRLMPEIELLS